MGDCAGLRVIVQRLVSCYSGCIATALLLHATKPLISHDLQLIPGATKRGVQKRPGWLNNLFGLSDDVEGGGEAASAADQT